MHYQWPVVETSKIDEKGDLRGKESEPQLELTQICILMGDIVKGKQSKETIMV